MPFLGDSRALEGPGIIPAQDFRKSMDVDAKTCRIAVRIVDSDKGSLVRWRYDETLKGDVFGLAVWPAVSEQKRPMAMWRHAWPCIVAKSSAATTPGGNNPGPTTPGNTPGPTTPGNGTPGLPPPGGEVPPGSRTPSDPASGVVSAL